MYLHFIIACFITTFFSIHGNPVTNKSVYAMIKLTASDAEFKCPYVRTTKLLEPEPDFLTKCASFTAAQSLTSLGPDTVQDGLCLLYYDNFKHLCYVSNNLSEITNGFLSNDQIDQTYQNNVTQICAILKNIQSFAEDSKTGIEVVRKYFEDSRKCGRICTDFDLNVKPICSLTAFMMNVTTKLYKDTQNDLPVDTKSEKAKNKPPITDHNADNTNNRPSDDNEKQNEAGEPLSGIVTDKNLPLGRIQENAREGQSSGTQKNVLVQNPQENSSIPNVETPDNSDFRDRWGKVLPPLLPPAKQHHTNDVQSAVPRAQPTSNDASINMQGKNPEDQSKVEKEGLVQLESSPATPQNKAKTTKAEEQLNAPGNTEQKSEPQLVNNPIINNENDVEMQNYGVTKPQPSKEKSVPEPRTDRKPDANKNNNSVENTQEGNLQQLEPPKHEDIKNDLNTRVENQNKLSTKVGEDVVAAGESPQDTKDILNDLDDDTNIDPSLANDGEEYNLDEEQPKSSEVKAKPVEKSKPREIDEDGGPSFAANYQNQSIDDSDSYFFSYFMMVCIMFICGYVAYHNKQKILALVVEGRKGRRPSRTRRPNSANYRKLDSNLEEAVTSSCNKNATQVIY